MNSSNFPFVGPGMKLVSQLWADLYRALFAYIDKLNRIHQPPGDYGLLCNHKGRPSLQMQVEGNHVILESFEAITSQGQFVSTNPEINMTIAPPELEGEYMLQVRPNTEELVKFGSPPSTTNHFRFLWTARKVEVDLVSMDEWLLHAERGEVAIPIAKFRFTAEGNLLQDESYIPPCKHIAANKDLLDSFMKQQQFIISLRAALFTIIDKTINQKNSPTHQALYNLSKDLLRCIQSHSFEIENFSRLNSPKDWVRIITGLASNFELFIRSDKEAENVLNTLLYYANTRGQNVDYDLSKLRKESLLQYDASKLTEVVKDLELIMEMLIPLKFTSEANPIQIPTGNANHGIFWKYKK